MEPSTDQLQRLFAKPQWTKEEAQWLSRYLEETDAEALQELMKREFQQDLTNKLEDGNLPDDLLERIHAKIGVHKRAGFVISNMQRLIRVLAAAAVVGLLLLCSYFFFDKAPENVAAQRAPKKEVHKQDVEPGGDKAVLTLADGSSIVLNDQTGELAQQGTTRVLKLGGKLSYEPTASESGIPLYNTITTPRGGQYQIILADGSAVWLNAASSLRFPTTFTGAERRVEVTGEAYFEVAKKKDKPFVVTVKGAEIQVLGTHFNVMAYADEAALKTTLLEGAVRFVSGEKSVALQPGEQSQLKESGDLRVTSDIDVEKAVSWKNGYFDFNGETIETVTRQLSRWYDIDVAIASGIEDRFYAEIPRGTKLSEALRALELTGKVHFSVEGRNVKVRP
ncbi:MAG: FecR domain-containing protein [Bacteroidota bacterium]|nr:FecR domain-containing protein [Bacteroidota bacterium]